MNLTDLRTFTVKYTLLKNNLLLLPGAINIAFTHAGALEILVRQPCSTKSGSQMEFVSPGHRGTTSVLAPGTGGHQVDV
jgi:hypothetical protein